MVGVWHKIDYSYDWMAVMSAEVFLNAVAIGN